MYTKFFQTALAFVVLAIISTAMPTGQLLVQPLGPLPPNSTAPNGLVHRDMSNTIGNGSFEDPPIGPAVCETTAGSPLVADVLVAISYYRSEYARGKVCCQNNRVGTKCTTINRFEKTAAVAMCGGSGSTFDFPGEPWKRCFPCPSAADYLEDLVEKCSWDGKVGGWKQMGGVLTPYTIEVFHR